jgi:hypothetical protein
LERRHVEAFMTWTATRPGRGSQDHVRQVGPSTIAHAVITLRTFLDDIAAWGWAQSPPRRLVFPTDIPHQPELLPRALPPDVDAAVMAAVARPRGPVRTHRADRDARHGLRIGELLDLELDCIVDYGPSGSWLRVPLGKLNNERAVPLDGRMTALSFVGWAAVYLRQTKRKNKDGTVAHYLQLAHNVRDPDTGVVSAKILHSFGRAEHLERESLERLIGSIARYLDQDPPLLASSVVGVAAVAGCGGGRAGRCPQPRRGVGARSAVATARDRPRGQEGRQGPQVRRRTGGAGAVRDGGLAGAAPSSKLEVTRWIADDVHIGGLEQVDADSCYRAMDFLLEALDELQQTVFFTAADLLSLDVDLIFFDTTSTYFELDFEDGELDEDGDGEGEDLFRLRGHSKDSRPDLPQVVIGMAVTTGGLPVRLWVWPGNTTDATVLDEVKADLAGWQLNRTVWVVDAGFASKDNRKVLTRGGSGFIIAETDARLRRAGRRSPQPPRPVPQGRRAPRGQGHHRRRRSRGPAVRDGPQPPSRGT